MPNVTGARSRVLGNIVSLYSLQGLNYALPVLVLPFLVRTLGIEKYGLIAFAQSFAQYFTILTDYGFNYSATRRIAHVRDQRDATSRVFSTVLFLKVLLLLMGALALAAVLLTVDRFRREAPLYLFAYLAVLGNVMFPTWLYQGLERMKYISIVSGAAKLLSAGALFIFIRHPRDYVLALGIQSSGMLVAGMLGLLVAVSVLGVRFCLPSYAELADTAADGWHLFVSTAAVSLYTNTNVFLVGMLAGSAQAGYFSAAEKLVRATQGLINPITLAIFPHVSSLAKESRGAALKFIYRSLKWLGGLTLLPSVGLVAFAGPIAAVCFGREAAGSAPVIRWIAFLPFLIAISSVLGVQTMVAFGLDRQFSRILLAAGMLNLVLALPLVFLFGAVGAGASVLVTETFVTATMWVVLSRGGIVRVGIERVTA